MKSLNVKVEEVKKLVEELNFDRSNYVYMFEVLLSKYEVENDVRIIPEMLNNNTIFKITILDLETLDNEEIYYTVLIKKNQNLFNFIDKEINKKEIEKETENFYILDKIDDLNCTKKLKKSESLYLNYLKLTYNLNKKNINIIATDNCNYICDNNNIYQIIENKELEQLINENIEKDDITKEEILEAKSKLLINKYVKVNTFDNVNKNEEIIFNNCIFNFKTEETRKIEKNDFIITYADFKFEKTEKEPVNFLNFLNKALKEDEVSTLQEFLGYSLKLKNDYKNFLILKGVKNSGKSTIVNFLQKIIGQNNICSIRPSELSIAEKCFALKGSLLNIVPELNEGEYITDDIKKITSGGQDAISIRKRYAQEETLIPCAKTIITTNYDVKFKDDFSNAIESRMILINFNKSVADKDINKNLVEELLESEGTEIVNWMLKGLIRLEKRGYFVKTLNNKVSVFNKMKNDNLTFKFIAENIEQFKDLEFIKYNDFKTKYEDFLKNEGYDFNVTNKALTKNLNSLNITTKDLRVKGDRAFYILFGNRINEITKMINEEQQKEEEDNNDNLELIKRIEKTIEKKEINETPLY